MVDGLLLAGSRLSVLPRRKTFLFKLVAGARPSRGGTLNLLHPACRDEPVNGCYSDYRFLKELGFFSPNRSFSREIPARGLYICARGLTCSVPRKM